MLKAYFHILPLVYAIVKVYTMQKCYTFVQNYGQSSLSRYHTIAHEIISDIMSDILYDIAGEYISIRLKLHKCVIIFPLYHEWVNNSPTFRELKQKKIARQFK